MYVVLACVCETLHVCMYVVLVCVEHGTCVNVCGMVLAFVSVCGIGMCMEHGVCECVVMVCAYVYWHVYDIGMYVELACVWNMVCVSVHGTCHVCGTGVSVNVCGTGMCVNVCGTGPCE